MHFPQKIKLTSLKDTENLAKKVAGLLRPGRMLALYGDLGAGKTTFARMLIQSILGPETEVPSPTFTLVQTYDLPQGTLWHFDLYRLNDPEEIWELGFEDAQSTGIMIVEWPERLGPYLPKDRLEIHLSINDDGTRICEMVEFIVGNPKLV